MLQHFYLNWRFLLSQESILERERKKQTQYEDRLKIEQEILDSASENAKLLVKAQQDRQRVLSDIEKVPLFKKNSSFLYLILIL